MHGLGIQKYKASIGGILSHRYRDRLRDSSSLLEMACLPGIAESHSLSPHLSDTIPAQKTEEQHHGSWQMVIAIFYGMEGDKLNGWRDKRILDL